MDLYAHQFFNDEDVQSAIDCLIERLSFYKQSIDTVRPKKEICQSHFEKLNGIVTESRGGLYYPYLSSGLGNGAYVECSDGSVKLDFISGIGCHWAHSDEDVIRHSIRGALHDTVMQGNLQQHEGSVELFDMLTRFSGLDYAFLTTSGVMSVENALKICFQYKKPASRILAFSHCFCGRTLAAASITDKSANRDGLPIVLPVDYVPFYDACDPKKSIEKSVGMLKEYLKRYPNEYACMKFELIQGEGGFKVGSKPFFLALMKVLKEHDIPVYIDEIQTFGRTTQLFAFQMFGLDEFVDIVTIGKLSQVCATLYKKYLKPKPGLISQTFTSSTSAIESSKHIINTLVKESYFGKDGKNARVHGYFARKLRVLQRQYPELVSCVNGVGTMISFVPFSGEREKVLAFARKCYDNGLICFVAGNNPTRIRFLVPIGGLVNEDIDLAITIIEKTLCDS
ncbi:acetylornithine aminotransferase [Candidatus Marinamargulisbacteria bacterium SCGC AG-343-D04]|nr:acetylornithine aminotransferase [Candidatus Marinamargulisbacteria bacterium SCGC AG-343-D04]